MRRRLLGFQLTDKDGRNIQGDECDPTGLASFEIMAPEFAIKTIAALPMGFLLMPIFEGDIDEPSVVMEVRT